MTTQHLAARSQLNYRSKPGPFVGENETYGVRSGVRLRFSQSRDQTITAIEQKIEKLCTELLVTHAAGKLLDREDNEGVPVVKHVLERSDFGRTEWSRCRRPLGG